MTSFEPCDEREQAVKTIFDIYSSIGFKPPPKQFTVLASFYLTRPSEQALAEGKPGRQIKVISLATGTKCTPAIKYSPRGELVHDSHAEVLARRGAVRWFLEEISRIRTIPGYTSGWLIQTGCGPSDLDEGPPYSLQTDVELTMYVSTLPCTSSIPKFPTSAPFVNGSRR